MMSTPVTVGLKWCPHCQRSLCITKFPVDRSRSNGRWHSCSECARNNWHNRGKFLRADRRASLRLEVEARSGLKGLHQFYSHQNRGEPFASVPLRRKSDAELIYRQGIEKDRRTGRPCTRQRRALRLANAASNAGRVGNRSFLARMNAFKRWKRFRELNATQEIERMHRYPPDKPRSKVLPVG